MLWWIILITISENESHVCCEIMSITVLSVLKLLLKKIEHNFKVLIIIILFTHLHSAKIHWCLNDVMIITQSQSLGINRFEEWPRIGHVLLSKELSNYILTKPQLIRQWRLSGL